MPSPRIEPGIALRRFVLGLVLLGMVSMPILSCVEETIGNASGVVVLLDYSKTYAPYSAEDKASLDTLQLAVTELISTGGLSQPVKVIWAAFGDSGLRPMQPCGPPRVFKQSILGSKPIAPGSSEPTAAGSPALTMSSKSDLDAWFMACGKAIIATSKITQEHTDVSGAFSFATNALEDVTTNRLLVMFSDLREDLAAEQHPARLSLAHGASVVLLWRPGSDDTERPDLVKARADEWAKRLQEAGAARVCARQAQGITGADIAKCVKG